MLKSDGVFNALWVRKTEFPIICIYVSEMWQEVTEDQIFLGKGDVNLLRAVLRHHSLPGTLTCVLLVYFRLSNLLFI